MFNLIGLAVLQSALLAIGQVLLKFGLARMLPFDWSFAFWRSVFWNWQFAFCGVCFGLSSLLWMYIIKISFKHGLSNDIFKLRFGLIAAVVFSTNRSD